MDVKVDPKKQNVSSTFTVKEAFLLLEQLATQPLGPVLEAVQFLMVCEAWLFKF